jgi:hypothetical protein
VIHTLPPPCTYRSKAFSNGAGTEIKSERTTNAYLESCWFAASPALTESSVNADSAAEPSAERKYSGERESPASETKNRLPQGRAAWPVRPPGRLEKAATPRLDG